MTEGTRHRVLIVDDERLLVESLAELLADDFDVVSAGTVEDGVSRLRADPEIHAVLCDLHLRDGTGLDLYRRCCESMPGRERRIVFFTGGNLAPQVASQLAATGNPCLAKPFDFDALTVLLGRVAAG
jgi:two-component system cell cycle sensor histidine kinase/response regulator CckA